MGSLRALASHAETPACCADRGRETRLANESVIAGVCGAVGATTTRVAVGNASHARHASVPTYTAVIDIVRCAGLAPVRSTAVAVAKTRVAHVCAAPPATSNARIGARSTDVSARPAVVHVTAEALTDPAAVRLSRRTDAVARRVADASCGHHARARRTRHGVASSAGPLAHDRSVLLAPSAPA